MEEKWWWVSWFSPEEYGGFELHIPFWRSGWYFTNDSKEVTIFVAAVSGASEEDVFAKISAAYDTPPVDGVSKRFCEPLQQPYPWEREGTRFVKEDWMELP